MAYEPCSEECWAKRTIEPHRKSRLRLRAAFIVLFNVHVVEAAGAFATGDSEVEGGEQILCAEVEFHTVQVDRKVVFLKSDRKGVYFVFDHRELCAEALVPRYRAVCLPPKTPYVDAVLVQHYLEVVAVTIGAVLAKVEIIGKDEQRRGQPRKGAMGSDGGAEGILVPCEQGEVVVPEINGRIHSVFDVVLLLNELVGVGEAIGVGVGDVGFVPRAFFECDVHRYSFPASSSIKMLLVLSGYPKPFSIAFAKARNLLTQYLPP